MDLLDLGRFLSSLVIRSHLNDRLIYRGLSEFPEESGLILSRGAELEWFKNGIWPVLCVVITVGCYGSPGIDYAEAVSTYTGIVEKGNTIREMQTGKA